MRKILILGGTRSGKSQFALNLGEELINSGEKGIFIATAVALDDEMKKRIEKHKLNRKDIWITIEEPIDIVGAIENSRDYRVILVDCLTLWLTNVYLEMRERVTHFMDMLCQTLKNTQKTVILVSNELGLGIVPDNRIAREFRDLAGELNQRIAKIADDVYFTIAGIPSKIK